MIHIRDAKQPNRKLFNNKLRSEMSPSDLKLQARLRNRRKRARRWLAALKLVPPTRPTQNWLRIQRKVKRDKEHGIKRKRYR